MCTDDNIPQRVKYIVQPQYYNKICIQIVAMTKAALGVFGGSMRERTGLSFCKICTIAHK